MKLFQHFQDFYYFLHFTFHAKIIEPLKCTFYMDSVELFHNLNTIQTFHYSMCNNILVIVEIDQSFE